MALSTQRTPSSSSLSSSTTASTYDVFLSFRGEDTRMGFTDHLHAALKQRGFIVFRDNEKIEPGNSISEELLKAIKESQYAIVVISKTFAFSKWCLKELNTIMECKRKFGLKVLPIFYHVDPSDVRKQKKTFAKAFDRHREDPKVDEEQREAWRAALNEVGGIVGWHVHDSSEATIVEQITAKIVCGLHLNSSEIFKNLVGIESQVMELISLLHLEMDDVQYIGIHGMGGVGKTTLAKVLYHTICCKFEASCFIYGTKNNQSCCVEELQQQIIHEILKEHNKMIWNDYYGTNLLAMRLSNKKVLMVLDDVNQDQMEALAGSSNWFGKNSRIVITSRDCQFLKSWVSEAYEVKLLNQKNALQLFCWQVFNKPKPEENFVELSKKITRYAGGLPLAIKLIGLSLVGKEMQVWNSVCDILEANPYGQILDKLEISYIGLDDASKKLFLDVACLFNGMGVHRVIPIWKSLGHHPEFCIDVLRHKSLLEFSESEQFQMHNLIQKMGQRIVHLEDPREPGKRSRLCYPDDIVHVLKNKTGTDAVEGIVLKFPLQKQEQLSLEGFSKLVRLTTLVIKGMNGRFYDKDSKNLDCLTWFGHRSKLMLSNELRVLEWWGYPLSSLRRSFRPTNLVELIMPGSCIKQLWPGMKTLDKLRYINLESSKGLMETPDFSGVPNIKKINLSRCTSLRKVHSSIGNLKRLVYLNLEDCKSLKRLPEEISLESLEELYLCGCLKLKKFPEVTGNMNALRQLDLTGTAIKMLPLSFQSLSSLEELFLSRYGRREATQPPQDILCYPTEFYQCSGSNPPWFLIPNWLANLRSLTYLDLSYCNLSDESFPGDVSLPSLMDLILSGNRFTRIPEFLGQLPKIRIVDLRECQCLQSVAFPWVLGSLQTIDLSDCLLFDGAIHNDLVFSSFGGWLGLGKNKFTTLTDSLCLLFNLQRLDLDGCRQLKELPKLPLNLKQLLVRECPLLEMIYDQTDMEISWVYYSVCVCVWFSAATIDGYNGTPYKLIQLHPRCPIGVVDNLGNTVSWGPTVRFEIPEWFHQRSTKQALSMYFGEFQSCQDVDMEDWKGYALFVVYEVYEDGFPEFICQFHVNVGRKQPLVLSVPEARSIGTNGFWAYIPYKNWNQGLDFDSFHNLGVSIASNSSNVEIKECKVRLIHDSDVLEFFDVLNSISPNGLELKELEEFEFSLDVGNY